MCSTKVSPDGTRRYRFKHSLWELSHKSPAESIRTKTTQSIMLRYVHSIKITPYKNTSSSMDKSTVNI